MTKKKRQVYRMSALSFAIQLNYIRELNVLISGKRTGRLEELAISLEITECLLMELLVFMIEKMHCPISYNAVDRTYFYSAEGDLQLGFVKEDPK